MKPKGWDQTAGFRGAARNVDAAGSAGGTCDNRINALCPPELSQSSQLRRKLPIQPKIPTPAQITPALLKTHSITADEYARIEKLMGRTPSLTELGIFSRDVVGALLVQVQPRAPEAAADRGTRTEGPGSVVQGPGENAGIIDVGDGWACAFKIESHNHPSYIEPYQGAATGVGGILRDIFTMNARPLAVMDSLRFGPLDDRRRARIESRCGGATELNADRRIGVVAGIAGYGNCFGVPNLGGETRFEACYSGNPLVNAFALGLVRTDEIFYAKATGVGNPVIYVGAKTGRDGIHGATMASEEFTEGSEQKRPNVQMGDPFMEKLLLEACLEAMATGAVLGIQDMGAAGLTCSTCEMGARGELGVSIELDRVPQRAEGMTAYEIMLSESQERMLLVADKGREGEVLAVFAKWGLDASIVGVVTADDVMRVTPPRRAGRGDSEQGADRRCSGVSTAGGRVEVPGADGPSGVGVGRIEEAAGLHGGPEEAAGEREYLRQALGVRAVRLDGADEYGAGARRRGRA